MSALFIPHHYFMRVKPASYGSSSPGYKSPEPIFFINLLVPRNNETANCKYRHLLHTHAVPVSRLYANSIG